MTFCGGLAKPRVRLRYFCLAIALFAVGPLTSQARADDGFSGPSFRKGLWHFLRTLDVIAHRKNKHRVLEREATRCVVPTVAIKATFASPSVGNCHSAQPDKSDNISTTTNSSQHTRPPITLSHVHT